MKSSISARQGIFINVYRGLANRIFFGIGMCGNPRQLDTEWCLESSLYKVVGIGSERSESGSW